MTYCDIAKIRIEVDGEVTVMEVPAYTREPVEFKKLMKETQELYIELSTLADHCLSVADYAMFLLAQATLEPVVME